MEVRRTQPCTFAVNGEQRADFPATTRQFDDASNFINCTRGRTPLGVGRGSARPEVRDGERERGLHPRRRFVGRPGVHGQAHDFSRGSLTQAELADRAEVGRTSIYKTVERLIDKGLPQRYTDGEHVHVNHERLETIYRRLRSFRDTETFERLFEGDYFSEHPDLAAEFDDLGRAPLPNQSQSP